MNKFFFVLVFSLLVFSTLAAARTTIQVPAIDSQGKGVITSISVEARQGSGKIRTDIRNSLVSTDTEESIRNAAQAAAKELQINLQGYDIDVDIDTQAQIIDGPSGGLALGVAIYTEFARLNSGAQTQPLRSDLTVTGTIDTDGNIGNVGGVEQKVQAAAARHIGLMLIAKGQSAGDGFDYIIYAKEVSNGSLQLAEVPSLHEALRYVYTPTGSRLENLPQFAIKQLELQTFQPTQKTEHVKAIAEDEIQSAQTELNKLVAKLNAESAQNSQTSQNDPQLAAVIRSVNTSLKNAQQAVDKGYYYTAANAAFLAKINLATANAGGMDSTGFRNLITTLEIKMRSYQQNIPNLTDANYEEMAGSELRFWWARTKLDEVNETFSKNPIVTPGVVRDYYTAGEWFDAADKLIAHAREKGGSQVNELNAREYALDLAEAAARVTNTSTDSEVQWHVRTGAKALSNGNYAAAAFDFQFAISIDNATKQLVGKRVEEINQQLGNTTNIANIYSRPTDSHWAELYYGHALYNLQENEASTSAGVIIAAFRLKELARKFSETKATLATEFTNPRPVRNRTIELPDFTATDTNQNFPSQPLQSPLGQQPLQSTSRTTTQPTVTATITPSNNNVGTLQAIALVVLAIGVIILLGIALGKRKTTISGKDSATMLDKLDEALVNGKISESTYKRLREKYKQVSTKAKAGKRQAFK